MQQQGSPQSRALEQLLMQAASGRLELRSWCAPLACTNEVDHIAILWLAGLQRAAG